MFSVLEHGKLHAITCSLLLVYLKVDPAEVALEPGFTRDVTKIGHFGTGNLEVVVSNKQHLDRALPLIQISYEAS